MERKWPFSPPLLSSCPIGQAVTSHKRCAHGITPRRRGGVMGSAHHCHREGWSLICSEAREGGLESTTAEGTEL